MLEPITEAGIKFLSEAFFFIFLKPQVFSLNVQVQFLNEKGLDAFSTPQVVSYQKFKDFHNKIFLDSSRHELKCSNTVPK